MIPILLSLLLIVFKSDAACTNGQIRLYDGAAAVTDNGMLQICKSGQWRAVCDFGWTQAHSIVVCKQLGYSNPKPITHANNGPSGGTFGYIARSYYSCINKTNISRCLVSSGYYLGSPFFCSTSRDSLRIHCNVDISGCTYKQMRLYNSTTNTSGDSGMLQICDATGHWTAVCDYSWGCDEAVVACKQLGYDTQYPKYTYNGGPWTEFGFGPYRYCSRYYTSLFSCSSYPAYYRTSLSYCNPIRDTIMLNCSTNNGINNTCSVDYDVRLVDGSKKSEGRLEICYKRQWTSICSYTYVDSKFTSTVCNQLGYVTNSFSKLITDGRYGTGTTEIFLTSPYCRSEYNNIKYCTLRSSGSQCNPLTCRYNHIGLKCYELDNCNEGDVRLVNGTVEREGRLEVCANGVWGQICSNGFVKSAAYVACKQLGYTDTNGALINKNGKYGFGEGPIIYSNLDCFGHETKLSKCSKRVYPNFVCYSQYIIGLLCHDACKEGDVRLVGGRHKFEGTVEICLDSIWCVIAQHGWDDDDARVVCRQIGGYNASAGMAVYNSSYGHPKRAVRYTNVYCHGHEEDLTDCTHHTLEFEIGRTYKAEVAGVDCGVIVSNTAIRTSSMSMSSSVPALASPYPSPSVTPPASPIVSQKASVKERNGSGYLFISGLLFLVIAITIMVIGIIIMVLIIARMKKLSISNVGRISEVRMSGLEQSNPLSIQSEYDDISFKKDPFPEKDDRLLS